MLSNVLMKDNYYTKQKNSVRIVLFYALLQIFLKYLINCT